MIIDQDQLPLFVSLGEHRLDAFPQPSDRRVKDRRDDTNEWLGRESKRLLSHSVQVAYSRAVALEPFMIFARSRRIFAPALAETVSSRLP